MKNDIEEKSIEEVLKLWLGIALVLGVAVLIEFAHAFIVAAMVFLK